MIETRNGKWYQMMIMPYLKLADNQISGAIITFNDVTALKQVQMELDAKNTSLTRINADLDHFIHAASHDLLAPLGNIETSINVMNKIALSDEKLMEYLNMINRSVKTFRLLITDIAVIAKVEGDMALMELMDMDDLINNIEWSLEDKIVGSGAVITRDLEVKKICFSKKNLRSILFNLVANAIKFRREEPPLVQIHTSLKDSQVLLSVTDNGKGIPEKGLTKIFEMYGRINQDIEGSGISLYLAQKIVHAADGLMEVESTVGKGSQFRIILKDNPAKACVNN